MPPFVREIGWIALNGASFVTALHEALGQDIFYLDKLAALGHPHTLFLTVPSRTYHAYFLRPSVQRLLHSLYDGVDL